MTSDSSPRRVDATRLLEAAGYPQGQANDPDRIGALSLAFDIQRIEWIVDEAIRSVAYSYEAGEWPPYMSDTVKKYVDGDGGLLNSLNLIKSLLDLALEFKTVPNLAIFEAIANAFGAEFKLPQVSLSKPE